jgi:hypothetical protein
VTAAPRPEETARQAARLWGSRSLVPPSQAPCTFALLPPAATTGSDAFCYVALSTSIEDLDWSALQAVSLLEDGEQPALDRHEVLQRLQDGHVGVVVGGMTASRSPEPLPESFVRSRDALRHLQVYVHFLVIQIALDEMTSVRGAASDLVDELVSVWATPLAITMDLEVLFTLGADRQRYVMESYSTTIETRRQALMNYLARRGVASNPVLAV